MAKMSDDWLWIGLGVGAAYVLYKTAKPLSDTVEGVGGGVSSAFQGVGTGVGTIGYSTGSNYRKVADALGNALQSDIGLLDIPKDVSKIVDAAKNAVSSISSGRSSKKSTPSVVPVTTNYQVNQPKTPAPIINVVAPKTGTITPILDSIINKPVTSPVNTLVRLSTSTTKTPVRIGSLTI